MSTDPVGTDPVSTDLRTSYLGLDLPHPVVASASPLTGSIGGLLKLEEAGAAAVVLPSLFEEQVEHEAAFWEASMSLGGDHGEATGSYFPALDRYNTGAEEYLDLLVRAKRELRIPVIASLNGVSPGGWTHYATALQDEGADALELNVYLVPADVTRSGQEVEDGYLALVSEVRAAITIPLAVKIGPHLSSPGHLARRLEAAGADALVLFNRFYQPDIDLDRLTVRPDLVLSDPSEQRLVLRWLAILEGHLAIDLAATTGIHDAAGVVKAVLAGADVAMMTSALLEHGPGHLRGVVSGVGRWFSERGYTSVDQARGSMSHRNVADPSAFERANYMHALTSYRPGTAR